MHTRIQRLVGNRLISQYRQLIQLAVQTVQFRDFQHVARQTQPGLNALDARQLLGQVFGFEPGSPPP